MSAYGRQWERVREIRVRLGKIVPGTEMGSLAAAMNAIRLQRDEVDRLLIEWAQIEAEMAKEE